MSEWSKEPDLRSGSLKLRGFDPHSVHLNKINNSNTNFIYLKNLIFIVL